MNCLLYIDRYIRIDNLKFINLIYIFNIFKIIFIIIFLFLLFFFSGHYYKLDNEIIFYKKYILDCKKDRKYEYKEMIYNKYPYISIVLPVYNLDNLIKKAILSIINQSFHDYEIIIINDHSNDKTTSIIENFTFGKNQIKVINHINNLGIYASRVDGLLNSKGKNILFVDADDMILNQNLFLKLYKLNLELNLDIIEFQVYYQDEEKNHLYKPEDHKLNHFHKFNRNIIYQPQLSNILFFDPINNNYSDVICRPIWNKMIKKNILLKTINFIGEDIYKYKYFNLAEDTIMNILNYQFAYNYSNLDLPGYLYINRKKSISHNNLNINQDIILCKSAIVYLKLFYKYIKYFNKDRNYLFYEMKILKYYLIKLYNYNKTQYLLNIKDYLNEILNDTKIENNLKSLAKDLSM